MTPFNLLNKYSQRKKEILFEHIIEELRWHVEAGNLKRIDDKDADIVISQHTEGYAVVHVNGVVLFILHPVVLRLSRKEEVLDVKIEVSLNRQKIEV